jgi:hypothetical protein
MASPDRRALVALGGRHTASARPLPMLQPPKSRWRPTEPALQVCTFDISVRGLPC